MGVQPDVAVLMPAAGSGLRMGGERKQLRVLGDAPVLVHTLRVFLSVTSVKTVIVAVPGDAIQLVEETTSGLDPRITLVEGGATRRESVARALEETDDRHEVVLVHDGVRPFVSRTEIEGVIAVARETGAASLAVPVADTLRRAADGSFGETVSRDGMWRMQTPQGFRRDWLQAGHRLGEANQMNATDDVELVQRAGHVVRIVEGRSLNFKITTAADMELAEAVMRNRAESEPDVNP